MMGIWEGRGGEGEGRKRRKEGTHNRPTAKIAKTPILRLVAILSLEMR